MATKAKKKSKKPTVNGNNGRDKQGRFLKGNHLGVGGNPPSVTKAKDLKAALLAAVTCQDIREIAEALVKKAKAKDVAACKELFDRCFGKPHQTHDVAVEARKYTQAECDGIREILAQRCN
jgi:ferritin-like protein